MARTAGAMMAVPNGFEPAGVLTFMLTLDDPASDATARRALVRSLVDGVSSAGNLRGGALDALPAVAAEPVSTIQSDSLESDAGQDPWALVTSVDASALDTLHVPLLEGRVFTAQEIAADAAVAMLSLEAARRYFGGATDALGRRLTLRRDGIPRVHQVVGVTGDVRDTDRARGMPPRVWLPLANPRAVMFVVRTGGDLQGASTAVRRVARAVVPAVPIEALETYDRGISRRSGGDRVAMGMLMSFAAVALLFATTGLYGTVALSTHLRHAEFATRYALGARLPDIAALVIGQAARLLAVGGTLGVAGGVAAGTGIRRLLYGVTPLDPLNLLTVLALMGLVTLAASLAPALRAMRIDVVQTMAGRQVGR